MNENQIEEQIKALAAKAVEVGVLTAAREEAYRLELAAEAELLERVAKLLPEVTRRALSVRVPSSSVTQVAGAHQTERVDYLEGRYVVLDDADGDFVPERERDLGDQNRGSYHGAVPALRVVERDGLRWCTLDCSGSWSSWQGEADRLEVEVSDCTAEKIARLLRPYGFDTALEWLSERLVMMPFTDEATVRPPSFGKAEVVRTRGRRAA